MGDIEPYIRQFDRYYDRMVSDTADTIKALEDVETIAENISKQVSERYEDIDRLAARTLTINAVSADNSDVTGPYGEDPYVNDDLYGDLEPAEEIADTALVPELASESYSETDRYSGDAARLPDYEANEPIPNTTVFWVLFCVSLPVTLPIAAAGLSLFAAIWAAIIVLMIASVAALISVAAGGTAAALVGTVYGIIQFTSSVATGVYEIGLGVVAAGCAMLVGILLYNLAVRLLPKLIKLVYKLFRFTLKQLVKLFNHLRRESAKL